MRIIAVTNQKGGVGKTAITVNLSHAIAIEGYRVLIVDMDPQAHSSSWLGFPIHEDTPTITDYFLGKELNVKKLIYDTGRENLSLLPANINLAACEVALVDKPGREAYLRNGLKDLNYDFVFIDTPPAIGLLTVNALNAATEVFIPIQLTSLALLGINALVTSISLVKENLNPALDITGVVMNFFDGRTNLSREIVGIVRNYFGDVTFSTWIPKAVKLDESARMQKTIFEYAPKSRVANAFRLLAKEILTRKGIKYAKA